MQSNEVRERFLKFFESRGHKIIPSSSLIPENDPSVLFNIAGMQPLMQYLLGKKHSDGKRLVNIQKCIRTVDLNEVGDNTHNTFFEMMGNWSLGDYFKEDAIKWSYEFLTSKDEGLGLDSNLLYVTVFGGSDNIARDLESVKIWKSLGVPENRIYFKSSKSNWWSAGLNSPAGPSTEMFYDLTGTLGNMNQEQFEKAEDEQKVVEIWNDVFMLYKQENGIVAGELPVKNVDTGAGLERITTVVQGKQSIYDTDLFVPFMNSIKHYPSVKYNERSARILVDHSRSAMFLLADGVVPSNKDQGYVLRRLIRRAIIQAKNLGLPSRFVSNMVIDFINVYKNIYKEVNNPDILKNILDEEDKFQLTLENGLKSFNIFAVNNISGEVAFMLFSTYGFPIEIIEELAKEKGLNVDKVGFNHFMKKHQELSRTASAGMFKGGLAGTGEMETKYHTATHLLLAALRKVLGDKKITQKGSNITAERMRFDFNWPEKVSPEKLKEVENLVNQKIKEAIPVEMQELPKEEAIKIVKNLSFDLSKYGDIIKIYKIGDFSVEFCGGPHVKNTLELGHFKIIKEEASSQGVRRIKAVLE